MSTIDRIRDAMHTQPFRPFRVKLVDGSVHTIAHLDFIALPPGPRPRDIAFFVESSGPGRYETHWINSALILDVIVEDESMPPMPSVADAEDNGA